MRTHQSIEAQSPAKGLPSAFFALTFLLSAPFYVLHALAHLHIIGEPAVGPIYIASFTVTPIAAAAILTFRARGSRGVRNLLMRAVDFRRIADPRWYGPILLLPPVMLLVSLAGTVAWDAPSPPALTPAAALPAAFLFFFILATGEEVGWMGYAFDRMQASNSALRASLQLGLLWSVWHVPFFVFLMPDPVVLGAQVLTLVGSRVLIAWIFNNARGSVFATILFHAVDNTALVTLPDINASAPWGPITLCGVTLFSTFVTTSLWGSQTLSRYRLGASPRSS